MTALKASTGKPGTWAAAAESIPSHIAGATAGSASRLANSVTVEIVPKWKAISGAVARVAAIVTAAPSASAWRQPPAPDPRRDRLPQRRGEQEDPDHRGEAELPADVGGDMRVDRQGDDQRQDERVEPRRSPARQRRQHPHGAHHSGPLDRRPGPGERDVEGDQGEHPDQALAQRYPQRAEHRHRQQGEQQDVLTRDGEQVAEPGAAEVFDRFGVDAVVLAEHEAARQLGLARRHPAPDSRRGAFPDLGAVEERDHHEDRDAEQDRQGRPRPAHRP